MDDEQWKNFRENMRFHRLKQGITNVKIAALLKKDKGWVSCTEAGAYARWPKPKDMMAIAKILGMTLRQMVKPIPPGTVLTVSPKEQDQGVEALEKIRKNLGLSKPAFAGVLGVTIGQYHNVTGGYASFSVTKWWQIARALDMDLNVLLGRDKDGLQSK